MAMAGVASLITTLDKVRERLNPGLKLYECSALPGVDMRTRIGRDGRGLTREALRKGCLQERIRETVRRSGRLQVARPTGKAMPLQKAGQQQISSTWQTRSCSAIKEASKHAQKNLMGLCEDPLDALLTDTTQARSKEKPPALSRRSRGLLKLIASQLKQPQRGHGSRLLPRSLGSEAPGPKVTVSLHLPLAY